MCFSETTIFRPGVAFQFSHVNIRVTDYAIMDLDQAMFFSKENIRYSKGLDKQKFSA